MHITPFEQHELAETIARTLRCNARILGLRFSVQVPLAQAEVASLALEAIEQYCDPAPSEEEREAAADARLTARYEEAGE